MTKHTVAQFCAIAAVVTLPSLSFAGTAAKCKDKKCCDKAAQTLSESAFSADLGVNVVTSYYNRGVLQTNHAATIQPYVNLGLTAYQGDGIINKVAFGLGISQSYTNPTFLKFGGIQNNGNNKALFDETITPSFSLSFGKFTLTESYIFRNFPNTALSAFAQDAQAISSKLSFDDSDYLGAFALHPSFTWVKETAGKLSALVPNKDELGSYYEASIAPSTAVGPVTVTLPITAGFGSNGFYQKDGYGYLSAGLNLGYILPVAKRYGTWTATAGATYYNLNRSAVDSNTTVGTAHNDVVGSFGLGVAF
ncbi:MAG: hypothetical protein RLZZ399_1106 [Verrucomicrobiota bacterium]|jgi:hypothetical protein